MNVKEKQRKDEGTSPSGRVGQRKIEGELIDRPG